MQQVAGRAERKRKELTLAGAPAADITAATALARRTREEAAQAYDELMRRRLEQSATSGAAKRWESLHTRCAERLLAMLLQLGNALNAGSFRSGAEGFKLVCCAIPLMSSSDALPSH